MIVIEKGKGKLYQQIYDCIKAEIMSGVLQEGDALLPIRELANVLHVGKNTVSTAYQNLIADGYVRAKQGSGYYVEQANSDWLEEEEEEQKYRFDFSKSMTARENFPWNQWRKDVNEALLAEEYCALADRTSMPSNTNLNRSISRYIKYFRGIDVNPEYLVLCSGVLDAVEKVKNVIADFANGVTFFEPCHPAIRNVFRTSSIPISTMPIQQENLAKSDLYDIGYNFLFLYTEHYMLERKYAGRNIRTVHQWIEEIGGYVIQYDTGLSGMVAAEEKDLEHMIIVGSFDSVMPEEIRLSYIIFPPALAKRYKKMYARKEFMYPQSYQNALTKFLDDGHLFHMIHKNTFWNKSKQLEFKKVAEEFFKDRDSFCIMREYAYMAKGIVVQFPQVKDQATFLKNLSRQGVKIVGAKNFWHTHKEKGEDIFIFGYTAYSVEQLREAFSIIQKELRRLE